MRLSQLSPAVPHDEGHTPRPLPPVVVALRNAVGIYKNCSSLNIEVRDAT